MEKKRTRKGMGALTVLCIAAVMISIGAVLLNSALVRAVGSDVDSVQSAIIQQQSVFGTQTEGEETELTDAANGFTRSVTLFKEVLSPESPMYGSGDEKGFYQIIANDDSSSNIMYVDYSTCKQSYLCQNESCQHNTLACTSYIEPSPSLSIYPALAGDKLLMLYTTANACRVEAMGLDGSNRQVLVDFADTFDRIEVGMLTNGESVIISCTSSANGLHYALVMVDLDTGEWSRVYIVEKSAEEVNKGGSIAMFMMGATDDGIVVKTIDVAAAPLFDESESMENIQKTLNELEQHQVYLIPFNGTEPRKLLNYTTGMGNANVSGGRLFYTLDNGNATISLHEIDTASYEDRVIIQDFSRTVFGSDMTSDDVEDYVLRQLVGDKLMINYLHSGEFNGRGDMVAIFRSFAINIYTAEMSEMTLSNYYAATLMPVQIVTQIDERRLLVNAIIEEIPRDNNPIPNSERTLAIISVEDYLDSNPAYQLIDSMKKTSW